MNLLNYDFKKQNISSELPSTHYIFQDMPVISSTIERIRDLSEIPSPYLKGKMDEFFDGKLVFPKVTHATWYAGRADSFASTHTHHLPHPSRAFPFSANAEGRGLYFGK